MISFTALTVFAPKSVVKHYRRLAPNLSYIIKLLALTLTLSFAFCAAMLPNYLKNYRNYQRLKIKSADLAAKISAATPQVSKMSTVSTATTLPLASLIAPENHFAIAILNELSQKLTSLNLVSDAKLTPLSILTFKTASKTPRFLSAEISFNGQATELISCFNALHQLSPNCEWTYLNLSLDIKPGLASSDKKINVTLRLKSLEATPNATLTPLPLIAKHLTSKLLSDLNLAELTILGFIRDKTLSALALGPYGKIYKISLGNKLSGETIIKITSKSITTNKKTYEF